ncbi:myeloperoxidase [Agromyces rhizosphaerae]|uniref:Myeloperoxidase n=1 Tax=Agromyces rhizosphaerae TaxID=88374 RepID=A0A9W6CTW3_9MICO|nr:peroxidase family protein [Agromyces rhizosphaerae]GLI26277.1 myeloperoxidase [Agromyces rhizosphaerae]
MPTSIPHSRSHEGRFGRLFGRGFTSWTPPGATDAEREQAIHDYVAASMSGSTPAGVQPQDDPSNSAIPAGYTYFGQFVDHDITFDPVSSLGKHNDPEGLQNFRSPRFDLDSLYGRGPDDQPYLYDHGRKLHDGFAGYLATGLGANMAHPEPDLQRNAEGVAMIGDPRNDENVIVSQLQLGFAKLHNAILHKLEVADEIVGMSGKQLFLEAQRLTVWAYQYVVWNDFIARITEPSVFQKAIEFTDEDGAGPFYGVEFGLKDVYDWSVTPYMPVEFSVAAYRFGHSMIRAEYQMNIVLGFGRDHARPIFATPGVPHPEGPPDDLGGFKRLPANCTVQWDWFFDFPSSVPGVFPQRALKIDPELSASVMHIPGSAGATKPLAELNIRRGWRMELPPATEVAHALHIDPRPVGDPMEESLWISILHEAKEQQGGERLGAVGSTIVAAVFSGLLRGDPFSYINRDPHWTPAHATVDGNAIFERAFPGEPDRPWSVSDLLKTAGMPIDAGNDIESLIGASAPPLQAPDSPASLMQEH